MMESSAIFAANLLLLCVLIGAFVNIRRQKQSIAQLLRVKSDQLQDSEEELQQLAFYDPLTGLPNRRKILDSLDAELYASDRYDRCGALFFIDLDNFKNINDTLGHDHGDKLLVELARRLERNVRRTDTVARLGGDEFLVLLQGESLSEDVVAQKAGRIAHKLLSLTEEPCIINGHKHYISISIGITLFPANGVTAQELLTQADTALYKAKGDGKNTLCFFHQDMQRMAEHKLAIERDLRDALAQDSFYLVYQPQVDASGIVQGAEALLRWEKADGSLMSPTDFIPVAEETGLILPLGDWVLEAACWQMKAWQDSGLPIGHISVNVSPRQFQQKDFVQQVERTLNQCGLSPEYLIIELTESVVVENIAEAKRKMERLRQLGVRISMDDFGTGYSSLSYLSELPFHELKIDQSFVRNLFVGERNSAITKTIIAMAQSLGLTVLAEGVEDQAQLDFLAKHNCSMYQGYLFSRPVQADEMSQMLRPGRRAIAGSRYLT